MKDYAIAMLCAAAALLGVVLLFSWYRSFESRSHVIFYGLLVVMIMAPGIAYGFWLGLQERSLSTILLAYPFMMLAMSCVFAGLGFTMVGSALLASLLVGMFVLPVVFFPVGAFGPVLTSIAGVGLGHRLGARLRARWNLRDYQRFRQSRSLTPPEDPPLDDPLPANE